MKKFILPSVSILLLGAAIVVVNAEDPTAYAHSRLATQFG